MRKTVLILLIALPFFASAQTTGYSIYAPARDSFFLVETVGNTWDSQLFRSEAQLLDYVQYLRNQATEARRQAGEIVADAKERSKKLNALAPKMETAADKIEAVARANKDVFSGKIKQPKPKKKKS